MDFLVFLSLTAILFNALSASSLPSKDHDITRRNIASSILPSGLLGPSVSASEALFREAIADKRWAKLLLKIDNFSTWRLEHFTYKIIKGEIGSAPLNVGPGMMEAIYAQQSYSFTKLEGLLHFQVDGNNTHCMIYWRIDSKQKTRHRPNMIGVGCQRDRAAANEVAGLLESGGEQAVKDNLEWRYSRSNIHKVRYCDNEFCLQAILPTSHQATVNADFIPRSINDWSSNSENDMSQRDIDIMISDPCRGVASDNCDLDTEEAETNWEIIAIIIAALIGVIFMVGCFAGCYMCVCKLGTNKTV